jgi:hypothetical protein
MCSRDYRKANICHTTDRFPARTGLDHANNRFTAGASHKMLNSGLVLKTIMKRWGARHAAIILFLFLLPCSLQEAMGANTGYKTAGTIVSSGSWSNFTTTRINTSDNSAATVISNNSYGVASTYGFSIPAGSAIDGVEVRVEGQQGGFLYDTADYAVQLSWNGGSSWVTAKTNTFTSTSDTTDTLGSSTDTWGRTWSDTELSDSNFKFRIYRTGGSFNVSLSVDFIQICVYYTVTKTWDRGAGTNNWGDANNWNPDGVPTSSDNVNLTASDTININVAAAANDLTLNNSGLTLTIESAKSLAVSGNLTMSAGTFNTQASFPTVSGTVSFDGGTFGYTLSGAQTVSNRAYYNLTLGGSGTKTMPGTSMTVNGDFTMSGTASATAAAALTVGGDFTIGNGCTFGAGSYTHTLSGNFTNNGTFTASTSTMKFNDAASKTISGSSTTTFNEINVDKGSSNSSVIEATSVIGMASGGLTLTNGTFKLSSNSTITPFTADITTAPYLIPSTAGLWLNGGTINSPGGGMSWSVAGLVQISAGTLNAGSVSGNYFAPKDGTTIIIEGGNLNLADRISQTGASWTYSMTGGTLTVPTVGSSTSARPPFNMDAAGCSFSMSGGTIVIRRSGGSVGENLGYRNASTGGTGFTGGTLQIGDASTPASSTIEIETSRAIYNLTVNGANSPTAKITTYALTVTNDVTLTSGTLNANNLGLSVGGNWTNNSSTSAFTAGSATVTLNGTGEQSLGGSYSTSFNSLTIANTSAAVAANTNFSVGATLTVNANAVLNPVAAVIVSGAGTLTGSGTVKVTRTAATPDFLSQYTITTKTLTNLTVDYNGAGAQTVNALSYKNLVISGSGIKTLGGNTTPSGNLSINSGTFDLTGYTVNRASGGGTLTVSNGASLKIGGTNTLPSNYSTHSVGSSSTIEYGGTNQSVVVLNSSQNYGNLIISGSGAKTLAGSIGIVGDLTISGGTFDLGSYTANRTGAGGTMTVAGGAGLKIGGTNTLPSNYSTHSVDATSTIEYSGSNQTVAILNSSQSYGNLTFSGSATKTLAGGMTVAGTLTITGASIADGGYTLAVNGNIVNSASHTGAGKISLTGGSGAHTLSGGGSYTNLEMNDANGTTLSANATVNGALTLTSGNITTNANTLYISSTGSVSRTSGHVVGNFKKYVATGATSKTYEIGDTSNYTPVSVSFASVSVAGDLTAKSASGDSPNIGTSTINSTKSANRYWTLTNSGITFTSYSATFNFVAGDVDSAACTSCFIVGKYSAGWTYPTVGTRTSTSTQITGLTSFSDFQLGQYLPKTWDGGAGTNNWGDANNWDPDGVPASIDDVSLTGANTIDVNVSGVSNDLTLNNAGLVLTVESGNSLTVSGNLTITTGTLNTEAAFPTVSGTTTLTAGTVGYTASSGSQTVAVQNYVNLTISGGGTKTLSNTITPSGNLSVNGGMFDLGSYMANRSTTGGTLTVANGATLKIGGTGTLPSNYSTHSIGATSTVEYAGTTTNVAALNSSQSYGNLTISGTGVVGSSSFAVVGTFTVNSDGAFTPAAANVISGTGTLTGNGTVKVTRTAATADFNNQYTINTKTLTNLTVEYAGASAQVISALTYGGLKINNASGVTMGGDATVNGALTFSSGNITTSSNTVIISSTGSVSRVSGHVVGSFIKYIATGVTSKTFEIGDDSNYTPVDMAFASVSVAGSLTAMTTTGDHGSIGSSTINASQSANRYWTLTNSGITFTSCSVTFHFTSGDTDGESSPGSFIVGRYSSGWTYPTVGTKTLTSTQATGVTVFGEFQLGNELATPVILATELSSVISDPISGGTNPKRIPGAVIEYIVTTSNSGMASPDANTVEVTVPIKSTEMTFYATGGASFTDGATPSGLAFGVVTYSQTAAPGPYVYNYTPAPDGNGYDGNITAIKVTTTGSFAYGGSPSPSFRVKFRVKIQ